jgi:hypothetical protein
MWPVCVAGVVSSQVCAALSVCSGAPGLCLALVVETGASDPSNGRYVSSCVLYVCYT